MYVYEMHGYDYSNLVHFKDSILANTEVQDEQKKY